MCLIRACGGHLMHHNHVFTLDLVRLGATLAILLYHFLIEMNQARLVALSPLGAQYINALAELSINLFFLLSGFTLALRWQGRFEIRPYLASRIQAIYPQFWVGFLFLFFYGEILHGNNAGIPRWKVVFSLLGLDGYLLPYTSTFYKIGEWYLGCQILLYLVFPLVLKMQSSRALRGLALLGSGALWLLWPYVCPAFLDPGRTVLGRLLPFAMGVMLPGFAQEQTRARTGAALAAGLSLSVAAAGCPMRYPMLFAAVFILLRAWLLRRQGENAPPFCRRLTGVLSGKCYGVFLIHHVYLTIVLVPLAQKFPLWLLATLFAPSCFVLSACLAVCAKPVRWALRAAWGRFSCPTPHN